MPPSKARRQSQRTVHGLCAGTLGSHRRAGTSPTYFHQPLLNQTSDQHAGEKHIFYSFSLYESRMNITLQGLSDQLQQVVDAAIMTLFCC